MINKQLATRKRAQREIRSKGYRQGQLAIQEKAKRRGLKQKKRS